MPDLEEKPIEAEEETEQPEGEEEGEESEEPEGEDSKPEEEEDPPQPDPPPGPRYGVIVRAMVGNRVFSTQNGDFLGQKRLTKRTYQYPRLEFTLNDPDGLLYPALVKQTEVQLEMGLVDGRMRNVFAGKIWAVGRRPPSGTFVIAAASDIELKANSSGVHFSKEGAKEEDEEEAEDSTVSEDMPEHVQNTQHQIFEAAQSLFAATGNENNETQMEDMAQKKQGVEGKQMKAKNNSDVKGISLGSAMMSASASGAQAAADAMSGQVTTSEGNTVERTSPGREGKGKKSIAIDWVINRNAFIGKVELYHRSPLQLNSGFGKVTAQGYSAEEHKAVGATVAAPDSPGEHPTGKIEVPDVGEFKLEDPIYDGCPYTWADATRNGQRVPQEQKIMERIAAVAVKLAKIGEKYFNGERMTVTSWYRPPDVNARIGGASDSRHLYGDAVDFWAGEEGAVDTSAGDQLTFKIYDDLNKTHPGGVAVDYNDFFCHVDMRHEDGGGQARWEYP